MLNFLSIKNLAIIDSLEIQFQEGLTILSGETGAGKSIVLQAISLLLGEKSSSDYVRSGEEECLIQAVFEFPENSSLATSFGEELRIKRSIHRNGKTRVWLNEELSSVSQLQKISSDLVEYISQHESSRLFDENYAREILDAEGGYAETLLAYQEIFRAYQSAQEELEQLKKKFLDFQQKQDFYKFQLKELEEARLKSGEEEELLQKRKLLQHGSKMAEALQSADGLLYSGKASAIENLAKAKTALLKITGIDNKLDKKISQLQNLSTEFEDLVRDLSLYASHIEYDDTALTRLEDRLEQLSRLKKKYASEIDVLILKQEELKGLLTHLENQEDLTIELKKKIVLLKKDLLQKAKELSAVRLKAAEKFSKIVQNQLQDLALPKASFVLRVVPWAGAWEGEELEKKISIHGADQIDFTFAPNVGEEAKKLSDIASGGELSRVILALRTVLQKARLCGTFIFDEIDSGMSGTAAEVVGKKIFSLSQKTQVICVTHLPQVASLGPQHYFLYKIEKAGRTYTQLKILEGKPREEEIARMFAGQKITAEALAHAQKLLNPVA
ncbi:MAG: DNA repair protein RecN [Deltaproteobacteria bacterium]|nr:DNA repair protein RecN [Deltaproteobacteria bacterium]